MIIGPLEELHTRENSYGEVFFHRHTLSRLAGRSGGDDYENWECTERNSVIHWLMMLLFAIRCQKLLTQMYNKDTKDVFIHPHEPRRRAHPAPRRLLPGVLLTGRACSGLNTKLCAGCT
jgi:hypothetical protein